MLPKLNNASQDEKGGFFVFLFFVCFLAFYRGLKLLENFRENGVATAVFFSSSSTCNIIVAALYWQIFDYIITMCKYFCTLPFYNKASSLHPHIGQQATFHSVGVTSK